MYKNGIARQLWVQKATLEATAGMADGTMSEEGGASYVQSWTEGSALSTFQTMMRSSGTLAVFTNALGNAVEQQGEKIVDYHTYAIFSQAGILGIFDPSFQSGVETFDGCTEIALAKALVKSLKAKGSKRKIQEVWIGGGGNKGTRCQEMTRKWLEEEIQVHRGSKLGNWQERAGWIRVSF